MRYLVAVLGLFVIQPSFANDNEKLLRVDHYVRVHSTVPSIAGQVTQVYVRELVLAGTALRDNTTPDRVVLFIHGAGTPAEVSLAFSNPRMILKQGFDSNTR